MYKPVQITRDPFARATLMRANIEVVEGCSCFWCGAQARKHKDGTHWLYHYWWERDSIYAQEMPRPTRLYCSVGCFRAAMQEG